jgi:hypothetical protein
MRARIVLNPTAPGRSARKLFRSFCRRFPRFHDTSVCAAVFGGFWGKKHKKKKKKIFGEKRDPIRGDLLRIGEFLGIYFFRDLFLGDQRSGFFRERIAMKNK